MPSDYPLADNPSIARQQKFEKISIKNRRPGCTRTFAVINFLMEKRKVVL